MIGRLLVVRCLSLTMDKLNEVLAMLDKEHIGSEMIARHYKTTLPIAEMDSLVYARSECLFVSGVLTWQYGKKRLNS